MNFSKFLNNLTGLTRPIKSLFGLYMLMYLLPLGIPFYIVSMVWKGLIKDDSSVNCGIAITIILCALVVLLWTIYFVFYFTKIRERNPHLYGKGFISGITESTETANSSTGEGNQITREQEE